MKNPFEQYTKKTFTVASILGLRPCNAYTRKRILEVFGKRKKLTYQQVWDLGIKEHDKVWLLLHLTNMRQRRTLAYAILRELKLDDVKGTYESLSVYDTSGEEEYFWKTYDLLCEWVVERTGYPRYYAPKNSIEIFEKYMKKWGYLK